MHRTITTEHSTGLLFLPITIACCLCITCLGLTEKLWRLAMFIKFRSIRICKTMPDLPSPTNTAVRSQQRLNTPEVQKVSNFYFVNNNLWFDLFFQGGGHGPFGPPWLRLCKESYIEKDRFYNRYTLRRSPEADTLSTRPSEQAFLVHHC